MVQKGGELVVVAPNGDIMSAVFAIATNLISCCEKRTININLAGKCRVCVEGLAMEAFTKVPVLGYIITSLWETSHDAQKREQGVRAKHPFASGGHIKLKPLTKFIPCGDALWVSEEATMCR